MIDNLHDALASLDGEISHGTSASVRALGTPSARESWCRGCGNRLYMAGLCPACGPEARDEVRRVNS